MNIIIYGKKAVFILVFVLTVLFPAKNYAASQESCAIWLCLPGGFPSGCAGAYAEFKHRLKKGKPPLPSLSSCSVDGKTTGRYELGIEPYESCKEGYVFRVLNMVEHTTWARCYREECAPDRIRAEGPYCEYYETQKRVKPNYVKMWVDGAYLGQFFY